MTFDEWYQRKIFKDKYHYYYSKYAWDAAVEETKKACAEAVTIETQVDGYICMRPSQIVDAIMRVEVK